MHRSRTKQALGIAVAATLATVMTLPGPGAAASPPGWPPAGGNRNPVSTAPFVLPAPAVLAVRALPGALPAKGGEATAVGKVRGATSCRLAVLGDHGVKVTLPKLANCSKGPYRERIGFGSDHTKSPVVVKLGLIAGRPGATSARGVFYVVVAGTPVVGIPAHPAVLSARAVPWRLTSKGGTATVEGRVAGAKVCRLAVLTDPGVKVALPKPANCSKGAYREKVAFGANKRRTVAVVKLGLFPYGLVHKYVGTFFVVLAGASAPVTPRGTAHAPTTTTSPTTTTTPATGSQGSGGAPPPPIIGPIPPSNPLPSPTTTVPSTSTSSTTTVPPTTTTAPTTTVPSTTTSSTTTVPPTTTTAPTTTVPATTTTKTAPTTTTTMTPLTSTASEVSYNWSGYTAQPTGGLSYQDATGTFTVPSFATAQTSCNDPVSTWVGVDGAAGSGYLLQAGVDTSTEDYATSTCNKSATYQEPWYEVITPTNVAPEQLILTWNAGTLAGQPAKIVAGNQVQVTITKAPDSTNDVWDVTLQDLTTGGAYAMSTPWAGPGTSAEWVVEDLDQPGNSACTWYPPGATDVRLCPLPDFNPVAFSDLGISPGGSTASWTNWRIGYQYPSLVSNPSTLELNGSFTVYYTPPASGPEAPANAPAARSRSAHGFIGPGGIVPTHR